MYYFWRIVYYLSHDLPSNYIVTNSFMYKFSVNFVNFTITITTYMLLLQLCIGLNNMYHVRKALINMPNSMELEKYYEWLDREEGIGERVLI